MHVDWLNDCEVSVLASRGRYNRRRVYIDLGGFLWVDLSGFSMSKQAVSSSAVASSRYIRILLKDGSWMDTM